MRLISEGDPGFRGDAKLARRRLPGFHIAACAKNSGYHFASDPSLLLVQAKSRLPSPQAARREFLNTSFSLPRPFRFLCSDSSHPRGGLRGRISSRMSTSKELLQIYF